MHQLSLSWVIGIGGTVRSGNLKCPSWQDIEGKLDQIKCNNGSATLGIIGGSKSIQVQCDHGNYLLTIGEDDGEDYHVRSFTNADAASGRIEILGDLWDSKMICSDFDVVKQAFKSFFDSGNVPNDLLS